MDNKVVAIVQARMGSSRLPGKVLLPLGGRPVLWHVAQRLAAARSLDGVLVATSVLPQDDVIAEASASWGVPCYRGSESDVLDRYYQAGRQTGAQAIVRLPADKPLLHPGLVDDVVAEHLRVGADYTSTMPEDFPNSMTYPYGLEVEVVSFTALERAWREATDPADREHVLSYIYQHPALFKVWRATVPENLAHPELRLCLDTPEDYELLRRVYVALWRPGGPPLRVEAAIAFLGEHPEIASINRAVQQRGLR